MLIWRLYRCVLKYEMKSSVLSWYYLVYILRYITYTHTQMDRSVSITDCTEEQRGRKRERMLSLNQCVCVCAEDGLSLYNLYVHTVCGDITGQRSHCSLTHARMHRRTHACTHARTHARTPTHTVMYLQLFTRRNGFTNHSFWWLSAVIELMRKWPQRSLMSSISLSLSLSLSVFFSHYPFCLLRVMIPYLCY